MSSQLDNSVNQRFSSRLGLLVSALGIAVGTGNFWRFPRIAAQSAGEKGAGSFLIGWVLFLFLWSIPLIIAEYALGKKHRSGPIGVFLKAAGRRLSWMGSFVAMVTIAIAFYYAVIVGWCLFYLVQVLIIPLPGSTEEAFHIWNNFQDSAWPFLFHLIAITLAALAIWKGIRSIEKVNTILIPCLLVIILISVTRAVSLPGSVEGIRYLFTPDWSQLKEPSTWLAALTQNAWDTGAGWGLFLTYAAYMQVKHGAVKNAFITALGNNTISLFAGIIIFSTVFSVLHIEMGMQNPEILSIMKSSGPASTGLTFIWLPQLYQRMFFGKPLAFIFFLGLFFASFTSLIAMLELASRVLLDKGMKRSSAILIVVLIVYLAGLPSVINVNFLSNQDFVWGLGLIISGAFISIAVSKNKVRVITAEINAVDGDWKAGRWWMFNISYFIPAAALILLLWWLFLSATVFAPGDWMNPFNPFSVMTCLVQWGTFLVIFVLCNRFIIKGL